jgi:XRE family transcriptional regulator, aerobic/anaerobic benzoate catabolism transcriptional regulator
LSKSKSSAPKSVRVKAAMEVTEKTAPEPVRPTAGTSVGGNAFLVALGERVRVARARRGMTRKTLAVSADVSERHLANLEYGLGNVSVLVLLHVSSALQCSLAELMGDVTTVTPEWLMLREMLADKDETTLRRARVALTELMSGTGITAATKAPNRSTNNTRSERVALIGLRGAGKSTLGTLLAEDLGFPLIELSREVEKIAGCSVSEIQALYGQNAYRRYERRALEETIQTYPEAVIATPGGIVSDPANFNLTLSHCTTVWLQAEPEDHMGRVLAQGDTRPMAASSEAMADLKTILAGRAAFYAKADFHLNTSAQPLDVTFTELRRVVREALGFSLH